MLQVKAFTSCLLFAVKKKNKPFLWGPPPPKYMVVTRELKFIFPPTLTCSQCGTGYNFHVHPIFKNLDFDTSHLELPINDSKTH